MIRSALTLVAAADASPTMQPAMQPAVQPAWPFGDTGMDRLMRTHDWAATPLGPIAGWPERLRTVVDVVLAMPGPATILWGPAHVQLYNDAYAAVAGHRHPALLGRPAAENWPEIFDQAFAPLLDAARAGRAALRVGFPVTLRAPSGGPVQRVFDTAWSPIRDEAGAVAGTLQTLTEVTERTRAEQAVWESEARFRGLAENSADVLWIADRTGTRLEYLSPAFETMFGEPRETILADLRRWGQLVHPEDRAAASGFMSRSVAGEAAIAHYRVVRTGDGRTMHLRDTGFPIRGDDGRIIGVGGIVQDVTDMAHARETLEAEKERFRSLAEGIPQLVWRSCDEGLWTWASPQWCRYTGQSQEASCGWGWLDAIHPDDRAATMQAWHAARPHGQLDAEYRVRRASDGAWRWHQTRSVPVRDAPAPGEAEGRILEWLGTTTDIEDLKRLQGQQQVLVAELQHRTRNLLAVVRNVARRSIALSPGRDEFDARLAALGRVQGFLSRSPLYVVPLADLVAAELQATGDGASAKVVVGGPSVDLPGESVQAVALALHELATNAVKYGAIAQPSGRLSVTWHIEGGDGAGAQRLVIDWHESGVAMDAAPSKRRGYGRELITQALPYQLQAETALEFTPEGVRCRIALPPSTFSSGAG